MNEKAYKNVTAAFFASVLNALRLPQSLKPKNTEQRMRLTAAAED